MFVAAAIAIVLGAALGVATGASERLRIADELRVAALVGVSGAIAGWALIGTVAGLGIDGVDVWDVGGAIVGSLVMITFAWRGRRRTFGDLNLTPHSAPRATGPTADLGLDAVVARHR